MEHTVEKSKNPQNPETVNPPRRTFLKEAGIALPAVMTLHSGAALANTSAARCLKPKLEGSPPPYCKTPDVYLRRSCMKVYNKRYLEGGEWKATRTAEYFDGICNVDGLCIRRKDGTKVDPNSTEHKTNINDAEYIKDGGSVVNTPPLSNDEKTWYGLCQYTMDDAKRNKVTLFGAPLDSSGSMTAHASCLTSIANVL
jgi:hypothetical protein